MKRQTANLIFAVCQTDGSFENEETLRVVVIHISPLNNNCTSQLTVLSNYIGVGVLFNPSM